MSEKLHPYRNVATASLLIGTLLVSGCGKSQEISPAPPLLAADEPIGSVPVLDMQAKGNGEIFTLTPTQNKQPEDIGIVYNAGISGNLLAVTNEGGNDHAVGLLLEEQDRKVSFSFIFFEPQAKLVAHIQEHATSLHNGNQNLFITFPPKFKEGYAIGVDPTGDAHGDVNVSITPLGHHSGPPVHMPVAPQPKL